MRINNITNFNYAIYKNTNLNKNLTKNKSKNQNPPQKLFNQNKQTLNFKSGLKRALTNQDYNCAKEYVDNYCKESKTTSYLSLLNLEKAEGIQKGIEVFEGLSIKDIEKILKFGALLLNRGCVNNCIHCGYSATPISDLTQDKMSFEDFSSLVEGIKELEKRTNNKLVIDRSLSSNLFRDSDCIDIELNDQSGKIYDYVDCVKEFDKLKFRQRTQFNTSGWNPDSIKHQKRAEKLIDYLLSDENKIEEIYISINPYHPLFVKSQEINPHFKPKQAQQLKENYFKRIANAMFVFTPLIANDNVDFEYNFLIRAINSQKSKTNLDETKLRPIKQGILKELRKMYENDYKTEKKYIRSRSQMKEYLKTYALMMKGADATEAKDDLIQPLGRAETLFKNPQTTALLREEKFLKILESKLFCPELAINPNGSIIATYGDISAKTDISLNFKTRQKPAKPFGREITDFKFIVNNN